MEPEQKKISLWFIIPLGLMPVLLIIFVFVVMYWPNSSTTTSASDDTTASIEQEIRGLFEEALGTFVTLSKIKDDGSVYNIEIELVNEPQSFDEAKTFSMGVCERCQEILEKHTFTRDIAVLVKYSGKIQGRTYYSQEKGEYGFKNIKELGLSS